MSCQWNYKARKQTKPKQNKKTTHRNNLVMSFVGVTHRPGHMSNSVLLSSGSKPGRYDGREHGWERDVAGAGDRGEVPGGSVYAWIKHLCLPGTVPGIWHTQTQMTLATNTGDKNCHLWFHARIVKLEGKTDYVTGPADDTAGVAAQNAALTFHLHSQQTGCSLFQPLSGFQAVQGKSSREIKEWHTETLLCMERNQRPANSKSLWII